MEPPLALADMLVVRETVPQVAVGVRIRATAAVSKLRPGTNEGISVVHRNPTI
jgi:hypothetical protein